MERLGEEPDSVPNPDSETPGHKAEKIVLDFLRSCDIGFSNIQDTSMFDRNDIYGIDAIGEIEGGGKVALDITFDGGERLQEKMERNLRTPCVCLHDERGRATSESLPRILIRDISMANWILYAKEAEEAKEEGGNLLSVMEKPFVRGKKKLFLEEILTQIADLSRLNGEYAQKIKPAQKMFQEHLDKIAA